VDILEAMLIIFAYEFPHRKTFDGLIRIITDGIKPDLIIGAPWVNLNLSKIKSPIRKPISPVNLPDTESLSKVLGVAYLSSSHDSSTIVNLLKAMKPQVGLILGARILPKAVISCFSKGIINVHPGVLPVNRGLDNIEKAVLFGLPQGVTTHFIDARIDMGSNIGISHLQVYEDDSLSEIQIRLHELQIESVIKVLRSWNRGNSIMSRPITFSAYTQRLDLNQLKIVVENFSDYKKTYHDILMKFQETNTLTYLNED